MSLGNNNQNNGKLFVLKVKTHDQDKKKLDNPIFQVLEKNEDNKWVITNTVPSVSGRLSRVDVKEGTWEDEKFYTVSLLVKDDSADESYLVDFKFNLMNRSIFNSLLNIDTNKDIKIGLYTSKKGYPAGSVRQGENLIDWKFPLSSLPETQEVIFKNKKMRDYSQVDDFFVEKLREFSVLLKESEKQSNSQDKTQKKEQEEVPKPEDNDLF